MSRPSHRESILDAAERVILGQGAGNLTLDAVATEAGMGKGGILYHFPNKDALFEGMIERLFEQFDALLLATTNDPECAGNPLKAHLRAMAALHQKSESVASALLGVAVNAPKLLDPARTRYRQSIRPFLDSDPRKAVLILAMDTLFMQDSLGFRPFEAEERRHIVDTILGMADDIGRVSP